MNDQDQKLEVLTNQPIEVVLGETTYQIRRMTATDFSKIRKFTKEKEADNSDSVEAGIQTICFTLSILLAPETTLTPEQVSDIILVEQFEDIATKLGLKKPQIKTEDDSLKSSTGADSTPV
jgi:hypothetical protein